MSTEHRGYRLGIVLSDYNNGVKRLLPVFPENQLFWSDNREADLSGAKWSDDGLAIFEQAHRIHDIQVCEFVSAPEVLDVALHPAARCTDVVRADRGDDIFMRGE